MRLKVKITTGGSPLRIRSGASTSTSVVGSFNKGAETIVVESQSSGGWTWYKLEDGRGWICGKEPSASYNYVTVLEDLTPKPAPQPAPDPTPPAPAPDAPKPQPPKDPPPPAVDHDKINSLMEKKDVAKDIVFGSEMKDKFAFGLPDYDRIDFTPNSSGFPTSVVDNGVKIYNYFTDTSFLNNNLKAVRNNLNLIGDDGFKSISRNLFRRFNRFKVAYPDYHLGKTFSHVFFTRPDLNLVDPLGGGNYQLNSQVSNDPVFYYLFKNNPEVILSLTRHFSAGHDFHAFLSNTASSFELSDEFIKTVEHGETFTGYKVQYGKNNIESRTAGSFSVSYIDDQDFSVYKTHKAWIEYISRVYRGEIKADRDYIKKKILDYACSVYYIVCGPDGETILFWSKYYGVFPTNAPSSTQSWSRGNMVKMPEYSINYAYAFKEDFSPLSLAEFNKNSTGYYLYKKTYEKELLSTGKAMAGAPFIETRQDNSGGYDFKLKFRYF